MRLQFAPYILKFKEPAGTSRGVLTEKPTCYMRLFDESDPSRYGVGEAAIFPGLSPEADERFFYKLMELQVNVRLGASTDLSHFPSLQSGFEQCLRDFTGGCRGIYYDTPFIRSNDSIKINGLIWMGSHEEMMERLEKKLAEGFHCIKLKIGAIDWKSEVDMIEAIRSRYDSTQVEIRVDANGAFSPAEALCKLEQLAQYAIHSIEQPVKVNQWGLMAQLCREAPIPIALDEELIGVNLPEMKRQMLNIIKPAYIVLKPSLHGGMRGTEEWVEIAKEMGIGSWMTSALESHVGLNAVSQLAAKIYGPHITLPQGLGTGKLYTDDIIIC